MISSSSSSSFLSLLLLLLPWAATALSFGKFEFTIPKPSNPLSTDTSTRDDADDLLQRQQQQQQQRRQWNVDSSFLQRTISTIKITTKKDASKTGSGGLDQWKEFEELRSTNLEQENLDPFFKKRPGLIVNRLVDVSKTLIQAQRDFQKMSSSIQQQQKQQDTTGTTSTITDNAIQDATTETTTTAATTMSSVSVAQQPQPQQEEATPPPDAASDEIESALETKNTASMSPLEVDRDDKLCNSISSLGPFAVKLGQTLSQRPDIVGVDAARALKNLQTKNKAFDNALAYEVLHESLEYWDGPLAPGMEAYYESINNSIVSNDNHDAEATDTSNNSNSKHLGRSIDPNGPTLFKDMTMDPIACASLGQVYKATMHDGREVAVKVQRPDALSVLAKDAQCFRTVYRAKGAVDKVKGRFQLQQQNNVDGVVEDDDEEEEEQDTSGRGMTESEIRGGSSAAGIVINRVAKEIKTELDYRIEAENSVRFRDSLKFLGFVTTPDVVQATDRVLITEWIPGRHLDQLSTKEEGLELTRMAVQACTASMVLTGFVHADPHEGNIMLHDDGRIVFLDFGLMSEVNNEQMEGFARAITAVLSEDWSALTEAFIDIDFVHSPIMHREGLNDLWRVDPKYGQEELSAELADAMMAVEGGGSRFGALATVLNKKISPYWLVFTPPYVILLCRTFLTLEGMAGTIDPEFNIYEMAMPWAVKRTLSPSTEKGANALRSTLLTEDNKIQWERILNLLPANEATAEPSADDQSNDNTLSFDNGDVDVDKMKVQERATAKQEAMKDALRTLMGSSDGRTLRRTLMDLDSVDLLQKLSSKDGRPILEKASKTLISSRKNKKQQQNSETVATAATAATPVKVGTTTTTTTSAQQSRPVSEDYMKMALHQQKWKSKVIRILAKCHLKRCLLQWRGFKAMIRFAFVSMKIHSANIVQNWFQQRRRRQQQQMMTMQSSSSSSSATTTTTATATH